VSENNQTSIRMGFIEPGGSEMTTREVYPALPAGAEAFFTRVGFSGETTPEGLRGLIDNPRLDEAAALLSAVFVDVTIFACTTGSLLLGPGFDVELSDRLTRAGDGVPGTTTATAVLTALESLGVRRLAVGTPYVSELNAAVERFLVSAGYDVARIEGLEIVVEREIAQVSNQRVADLARRVAADGDIDAVFLSCTNLPTFEVLRELEDELGLPVISSNAATLWHALGSCGGVPDTPEYGRLLGGGVTHPGRVAVGL
jgi:maleate isomerase